MSTVNQEVEIIGISELDDGVTNHRYRVAEYIYLGVKFQILFTDDPPVGYDRENALELEWLEKMEEFEWFEGSELDDEKLRQQNAYMVEIELKIRDIALPFFQKLAPTFQGRRLQHSLPPGLTIPTRAIPAIIDNFYSRLGITIPIPRLPPPERIESVQQHHYPDTIRLELVTLDNKLCLIERTKPFPTDERKAPITPQDLQNAGLGETELSSLTIIPASEVYINHPGFPSARQSNPACIPNTTDQLVCKVISHESRAQILNEIIILYKLSKANLSPEARVPKLRGKFPPPLNPPYSTSLLTHQTHTALISHPKNNIIGFLTTRTPTSYPTLSSVLQHRFDAPNHTVSLAQKEKWLNQLDHTVSELHGVNLIWGDVQPDNIIIDTDDNAWVTEFGRWNSPPWAAEEMRGTKEGDILALGRLRGVLLDTGSETGKGYRQAVEGMMEEYVSAGEYERGREEGGGGG